LGRTVGQILRDPEAPMHDPAFYQFTMAELHAGRSWMGALAGRARDGHRIFTEVNVAPFCAQAEGFLGHAAIRRNLEHRKDREAALAVAHNEFRAVLSGIPDGACVLRDGRIYFANAAFLNMLKLSEEGVIGRPFAEFVHADDRAQFEREHESKVTRVRVSPADGLARFVEISAAGAVSFEGKPAMILLSRDTTDYQLAREELSRTEKLSALGSLAAGVAHELNNPLAYVALNLDLLAQSADKWLPPAERDALKEAIEGIQRLRDITGELRAFSGADGPGQAEPVDVSRAVSSALSIAQNEIRHRARLVRDLEDGVFVLAREGQLVQVLVNVLVNAAQAIVANRIDGQVIAVRSRRAEGGSVEIVVSDTGAGIPDSLLPHLFAPFTTSKRRGEGSGLGLAICKRIVTGFGGQIRVDSVMGKGTQVTIVLEGTSRAPAPPSLRAAPSVDTIGQRRRVLIVDDEVSIARALKRVLSGYEIVVAADGHAALKLLEGGAQFDVVLCDLMMPGLSGEALHDEARRLNGGLAKRFVFMTGGALMPANAEFLKSSRCPVLLKPFDPSAVIECIEDTARRMI
jgi:PAS domain S-box-containing protein